MHDDNSSLVPSDPEIPTPLTNLSYDTEQSQLLVAQDVPHKKNRKPLLLLLAIALLLVGSGVFYITRHKKEAPQAPAKSSAITLANAKPQFSQGDSVAGYLTYSPTKFKEVSTIGLPAVKISDPNVNTVIVEANVVGYGDSGLYLYDLSSNKTFKLTSGGGNPRIMSDHFVVYGLDEGKGNDHKINARLLDLKTGENKVIFSSSPENVPGTACCSVSPDGFMLALPEKNKITVWDIRSDKFQNYPVTLNPVAEGSTIGALGVEASYAAPVWAGNESIIYADKPATKTIMVDGAATKPVVNTNLFLLNLADGKSSELVTGNSGIYDVYTRENGGIIFTNETTVDTGIIQFTEQSLDNKPTVLAITSGDFTSLSPSGDKLFVFPILYRRGGYIVVDTNTKTTKIFNPIPENIAKISQIIPKGWAGEDKIILEILDTSSTINHDYIAIYNTTTNKIDQYTTIK